MNLAEALCRQTNPSISYKVRWTFATWFLRVALVLTRCDRGYLVDECLVRDAFYSTASYKRLQ